MPYVEGFVAAVPTTSLEAFRRHAAKVAEAFRERGALKVVECWGTNVPEGEVTSLPKAVACQPDETVTFSWVIWPSREARDKGMENFMDDPRVNPETNPIPFDGKRMIWGGFEVIVDA
jgi:uncharacterized protein YbaA (DUF1428 family)